MDPVSTIASFILATSNEEREDCVEAWRGWRHNGGCVPLTSTVRGEVEKRGFKWTRRMALMSIMIGTI